MWPSPGPGHASGAGGCPATSGHNYTTNFPLTENPISECNSWLNGAANGLDWFNVRTNGSFAFGTQPGCTPNPPTCNFTDSTAVLVGTWNNNQAAWAKVHLANPTDNSQEEVELRLRTNISAHSIAGYEMQYGSNKVTPGNCYTDIVRWNGALNSFNSLNFDKSSNYCLSNGDMIYTTVLGATPNVQLTEYKCLAANNFMCQQIKNTTDGASGINSGSTGQGFYLENDSGSPSSTDFGFSSFSSTDSPKIFYNSASHDQTTSGTTSVVTMPTTTTGNTLWCAAFWNSTIATATVSDVANGTYTAVDSPVSILGATYQTQSFYKINIVGATNPSVTLTTSGSTTDRGLACHEVSGVTALDQHPAVNVATGTAMTSATTSTTATAYEYMTGWCVVANTTSGITSPWVLRQENNFGGNPTGDSYVVATGTFKFQATQTSSGANNYACGINTFK